jgi:hypothetical protein
MSKDFDRIRKAIKETEALIKEQIKIKEEAAELLSDIIYPERHELLTGLVDSVNQDWDGRLENRYTLNDSFILRMDGAYDDVSKFTDKYTDYLMRYHDVMPQDTYDEGRSTLTQLRKLKVLILSIKNMLIKGGDSTWK